MPPSPPSALTYDDVILGRRSICGYKRDPAPKAVIREVIEMAMRAPSSLNAQPWNFYVVGGAVLDRIRAGNTERNLAGVPDNREFRSHGAYEGAHRERQIGIAMGYRDDAFPANAVVSERKSVDQAVVFVGLDD